MKACSVAFASLFVASVFAAGISSPASAASPAYCALYAREYSAARIGPVTSDADESASKRVEDQAYFRCLNLDEEPEFPASSAYAGASVEDLDGGASGPFQDIAEGDTDTTDDADVPATGTAGAAKAAHAAAAAVASNGTPTAQNAPPDAPAIVAANDSAYASGAKLPGTGLAAWSPQWLTWCKSHFPHSFDPKTGFVVPVGEPKRFCGA